MPPSDDDSRRPSRGRKGPRGRSAGRERISVVRRDTAAGAAWEIVQPRCARRRQDDVEEVEAMLAPAGTALPLDIGIAVNKNEDAAVRGQTAS